MPFGVDEAGKGPVLGSMFAACVRGDPADLPAGVADSKRLAPERREELAAVIRASYAVGVAEIPVARIDGDADMNTLTVAAHAEALENVVAADDAAVPDAGVLDAADTDAERFGRRVTERLPYEVDLRAEHGADEDHPLVSAASIVAKVERDAHVETLAQVHGDVGSGYPSDPTTREFLRGYVAENGCLPDCARESWATSRDALAAGEQAALEEF